jgi:hypothetical protein
VPLTSLIARIYGDVGKLEVDGRKSWKTGYSVTRNRASRRRIREDVRKGQEMAGNCEVLSSLTRQVHTGNEIYSEYSVYSAQRPSDRRHGEKERCRDEATLRRTERHVFRVRS